MAIRFQPTIAADWANATPADLPRPEPVLGRVDEQTARVFQRFNVSIPPFRTPEFTAVANKLSDTMLFNEHRPFGGRRVLIVDGVAHIGKTTAILAAGAARVSAHDPPITVHDNGRVWPIPWAYVEASAQGHGRALARSLCTFLGLPIQSSETAQTSIDRVACTASALPLEVIVIDDFHMLGAATGPQQEQIANTVKHLITAVPATFVIAGNNLAHHPLVQPTRTGSTAADQIRARADWAGFRPWPYGSDESDEAWRVLFGLLKRAIALPRGEKQWKLDQLSTLHQVQQRCGGRPSTATEWIITAANAAIANDIALNLNTLNSVRDGVKGLHP